MSKPKITTLDSLSLHSVLNEDSELIPLMTPEDEAIINKEKCSRNIVHSTFKKHSAFSQV